MLLVRAAPHLPDSPPRDGGALARAARASGWPDPTVATVASGCSSAAVRQPATSPCHRLVGLCVASNDVDWTTASRKALAAGAAMGRPLLTPEPTAMDPVWGQPIQQQMEAQAPKRGGGEG